MTTKKQRDLVAGMKWPPCELTPTKTTRPEGRVSPRFAVEDQGDRFILYVAERMENKDDKEE